MVRKEINTSGTIIYFNEQEQYHREDGPAIDYTNGDKYYYLMGKEYFYEDWIAIKDFSLLW